jgi:hypothetical protein
VPEAQAKAMSEAFRDAQGELDVATKRDLKDLELKLDGRFESIRGELTPIKWMLGLLLGCGRTDPQDVLLNAQEKSGWPATDRAPER